MKQEFIITHFRTYSVHLMIFQRIQIKDVSSVAVNSAVKALN